MSAPSSQAPELPKGRQAILNAVVAVVAQKGLRGLTFRSVAAEAGVSPTLAAHYFGTRDALIEETLAWVATYAIDSTRLEAIASSHDDYEDALVSSVIDEPALHAFQIEMILEARRRPELRPHLAALYESYLSALRVGAKKAGLSQLSDPVYRAVFAGIDGLILQYFGGAITIKQFRESVLALWNLANADAR